MNKFTLKNWILWLTGFLCFSLFISKSGVTAFAPLLSLVSLIYIFKTNNNNNNNNNNSSSSSNSLSLFIKLWLSLYPVCIFLNLFSLGGIQSALQVTTDWHFPILTLAGAIVYHFKEHHKLLLKLLLASCLIGCIYGIYQFGMNYNFQFHERTRVSGFWDISRWGVFLGFFILGFVSYTTKFSIKKETKYYIVSLFISLFVFSLFFLANTRAPWLALGGAFMVSLFLRPQLLKILFPLFLFSVITIYSYPPLYNRLQSIITVEKSPEGHLSSQDKSNEGRLYMWQVALRFTKENLLFGVGYKNTAKPLIKFLNDNPEIREKYTTPEFSYNDQHSSFLFILVQHGLIFFILFWGLILWSFVLHIIHWIKSRNAFSTFVISLYVYHGILFIFYSSVTSYEMVSFFPFLSMGFLYDYKSNLKSFKINSLPS